MKQNLILSNASENKVRSVNQKKKLQLNFSCKKKKNAIFKYKVFKKRTRLLSL